MRKLDEYKYILFVGAGLAAEWIYKQIPDIEKRLLGVVDLLDTSNRKITTFRGRKVSHIKKYSAELKNKEVAVVMAIGYWDSVTIVEKLLSECGVAKERLFVPNPYVSLRTCMRCQEFMHEKRVPFSDIRYEKIRNLFKDKISIDHYKELTEAIPWDDENSPYELKYFLDMEKMYYWEENYWKSYSFEAGNHGNVATVFDCGAYIGDSIDDICNALPEKVIDYYSFEPNSESAEIIRNKRKTHGKCRNFEVIECGVGNDNTEKYFLIEDDVEGGKFVNQNAQGTSKLEIRRIDDLDIEICGQLYIKMDIEGSELDALKGAKETICKYRPYMAICLYHKKNDLLEIPSYINEIVPNYQFYLRGGYHTILWAIPEEK